MTFAQLTALQYLSRVTVAHANEIGREIRLARGAPGKDPVRNAQTAAPALWALRRQACVTLQHDDGAWRITEIGRAAAAGEVT